MKLLIIFFTSFISVNAFSKTLSLRSLSDFSLHEVKITPDSPAVIVVFQKDCHACRKQVKNLNCLSNFVQTYLIGTFSHEKDLRTEYRRFNTSIKGLYGDKAFKKYFQTKEPVTPQIVIAYPKQNYLMLGFTPCQKIKKFIETKKGKIS